MDKKAIQSYLKFINPYNLHLIRLFAATQVVLYAPDIMLEIRKGRN